MNYNQTNVGAFSLVAGLTMAVVMLLIDLVLMMLGVNILTGWEYLAIGILLLGTSLLALKYKSNLGGYISYRRAMGVMSFTQLIAIVLFCVWLFYHYQSLMPGDMVGYKQLAAENYLKFGYSDSDIDMLTSKINPLMITIGSLISFTIFTHLISLLIALAIKKNKPMFEGN